MLGQPTALFSATKKSLARLADLCDRAATTLDEIQKVTGGVSVGVNLDIARGNVDLAAKISRSWSERAAVRAVP